MISVDTSFFYALASANDSDHERVREVSLDEILEDEKAGFHWA